jgi:hypothetical protein
MLSVRHQRAVLATPQFSFRILGVRFVAKFRYSGTHATWSGASNVVSRNALAGAGS